MKKNVLTKINKAVAVLSVCSVLFTIVLPFGTIIFDSESGVSYESAVSTYSDDQLEFIKNN